MKRKEQKKKKVEGEKKRFGVMMEQAAAQGQPWIAEGAQTGEEEGNKFEM